MQTTKSVIPNPGARTRRLEQLVKGFANHRRIEILELLEKAPELSVGEISLALKIEMKTASEHIRRSTNAGLIVKRNDGREVRHRVTPRGKKALTFLRTLE